MGSCISPLYLHNKGMAYEQPGRFDPMLYDGGLEEWVERDYTRIREMLLPKLAAMTFIDQKTEGMGTQLRDYVSGLVTRAVGAGEKPKSRLAAFRATHLACTIASMAMGRPAPLVLRDFQVRYRQVERTQLHEQGDLYLQRRPALHALVMEQSLLYLNHDGGSEESVRALAGLTFRHLDLVEQERPVEKQIGLFQEAIETRLDNTVLAWPLQTTR